MRRSPALLLGLGLALPSALSLQCVRLQPTAHADALAKAAAALGAVPVDHADGTLELLSDGPLERVLARLQQEEGRPVGLAGPPEPLLEADGSTADYRPLLVNGELRIAPLQEALPTAAEQEEEQARTGVAPLALLDGEGVFMLTTACAFHQSTRLLLELMATHRAEWLGGAASCEAVLDYGCGSGVLALAALRLSAAAGNPGVRAYATDVNEAALVSAARNGAINGLGARLTLALPWELGRALRAQLVLANMLPGPLISVAEEIAARTEVGGVLLLSGFKAVDLAAVTGAYEPWFEVGAGEGLEEEGWLAVRCVRKEGGVSSEALSEGAVG